MLSNIRWRYLDILIAIFLVVLYIWYTYPCKSILEEGWDAPSPTPPGSATVSWLRESINKFVSENDIAYYQFESHDFLKEMTIQTVQQYIYMANQSTLLMRKTKGRRRKKQFSRVRSSFKGVIGWRLSSCSCRNLVSLLFLLSKLVWHLLQCHK